jgi:hypothetical protein
MYEEENYESSRGSKKLEKMLTNKEVEHFIEKNMKYPLF